MCKHARTDAAAAAPGKFCMFAGAGLKGKVGIFFKFEVESFFQSDVSRRMGGGARLAIFGLDIGRAMLELGYKTGAFTHGTHSVEQPMTAERRQPAGAADCIRAGPRPADGGNALFRVRRQCSAHGAALSR